MATRLFGTLICLPTLRLCLGMAVHPIVIRRSTLPSTSTPGELIIFLHGRLEADEHESNISIPDPSDYTLTSYRIYMTSCPPTLKY